MMTESRHYEKMLRHVGTSFGRMSSFEPNINAMPRQIPTAKSVIRLRRAVEKELKRYEEDENVTNEEEQKRNLG